MTRSPSAEPHAELAEIEAEAALQVIQHNTPAADLKPTDHNEAAFGERKDAAGADNGDAKSDDASSDDVGDDADDLSPDTTNPDEYDDLDADEAALMASMPPATLAEPLEEFPEGYRSGFVCLVGRPNAGKSTLTNALVGEKVAITSNRPQTTRHTIRGIVHRNDAQIVLVDTPGIHRPRTLLGRRLNDLVAETLAEVDVIGFCLPADQKIGPGDRYIAEQLLGEGGPGTRTPVVAIVTKTDATDRETVAKHLLEVNEMADWADIVPVSAKKGHQVDTIEDIFIKHLPEGPPLYPKGELTDEPEDVLIAEYVREAALEGVRDELPHSLAVVVNEKIERTDRDDGMLDVHVELYVERDSQKGIIIGKGGARLREIGSTARQGIVKLLGVPVNLQLHVRVAKDWQRDPKGLQKLGF